MRFYQDMEDMYTHQCVKEKPNQFIDGTVIGPNAHTHSPLNQTLFYHRSTHFIPSQKLYLSILYLSIYLSYVFHKGEQKFLSLQTYPYVCLCMQYPVKYKL